MGEKRLWKRPKSTVKDRGVFQGGRPTDVIIPIMGKTGVGKSTFINTLFGKPVMEVGHDIVSCTNKLQWKVIDPEYLKEIYPNWGDRRVIIVDTPGFDDTFVDDLEILRRIAEWLASSYADDMQLGGVIYLQNLAEARMEGASRRNLEMFKKLCGTNALSRVILGTTHGQEVKLEIGEARERELRSKYWNEMIKMGSTVKRFDLTQVSAFNIIQHILDQFVTSKYAPDTTLVIQKELVDMKKQIPQTAAGMHLLYSIEEILERRKQVQPGDEKEEEEWKRKVLALEAQMKGLRLPFFARFKSLFGI